MSAMDRRAYDVATERDGGRCQRCGLFGVVQRDHRKNRSQGGRTLPGNLQLLCVLCHVWKGENPKDANGTGYGCPGWAKPTEWPARRFVLVGAVNVRRAWVLYDDVGGWEEISERTAHELMGVAA